MTNEIIESVWTNPENAEITKSEAVQLVQLLFEQSELFGAEESDAVRMILCERFDLCWMGPCA